MPEQVNVVYRLSPEVYRKLEDKLHRPFVTTTTTAHEAGYMLGIAAALRELRNGYVVEVQQ